MPGPVVKSLLAAIALASAATAAAAEGGRQPSAAALALARAVNPERVYLFEAHTLDETRAMIERRLLNSHFAPRGEPCERRNDECAAIARQLAEREAPAMLARHQAAVERTYARYFEAHLSEADIEAARAFVQSPAGRVFADAITALAMIRTPAEDDLYQIATEEFGGVGVGETVFNEFYDRTAHLPRSQPLRVPPPPPRPAPRPPQPPR